MEGAVIFALFLLAFGLFASWGAILGWLHRGEEHISLLEGIILKATGEEPLPLTKFDRWLQKFQLVMMGLFGPALVVLGAYGLLSELEAL